MNIVPDPGKKVAFFATGGNDGVSRIHATPRALTGEKRQLTLWTEIATGMEIGENNVNEFLDAAAWHDRKKRFEKLAGDQ